MKIDISLSGLEKTIRKIDKIAKFIPKLQVVMFEIALRVTNDAKDFVTGRQSLSKYQKQSAAEKNATYIGIKGLGVMTDRLRSSINGEVEKITSEFISVVVSTNVEYALIHEIGGKIVTKHATIHMPARPFLYASLLKNKNWIIKRLHKEIKRLLK